MPLAALRINIPANLSQIDEERGVIPGCRLSEVNSLATFSGPDGKPIELRITPSLIDGLLGLAQKQGRLDAYWTHDRLKSGCDPIHDSVGLWSNFAKDSSGNLTADLNLEPSKYREKILWKAKNDPSGIMTSLVFDYTGGKDDAKATDLISGDLVRFGAATSALLSAYKQTEKQEIMEPKVFAALLCAALATPEVKGALKAAMADDSDGKKEAEMSEEDAKALEDAAGVTEEDKKDDDKEKTAEMRAHLRIARANKRQIDNAAVLAEARVTSKLGNLKPPTNLNKDADKEETIETAITAAMSAGCNRAEAIRLVANKKPALYNKAKAEGKI